MNKVAIVIVNWNAGDLLRQTLAALEQQTYPIWKVVIVDNASSDNSWQNLDGFNIPLDIVHAGKNLGFAAGNNHALPHIEGADWLALLNPDAFPEPDWLANLVKAAEQHPEYAFFASRLLVADDVQKLDGIGDDYHTSGIAYRRYHGRSSCQYGLTNEEVFSPCAAAALYRLDAFKQMGGFDEDYFCYMEDIDLSFRLRLAGYRCLYVANAVVHHIGSALTGKRSDFSVYHGHRNLVWTYVKNMPGFLFYLYLPQHFLLNFYSLICLALRGQARVTLKAKWDAIKGLPIAWRKRKQIQTRRQVSTGALWKLMAKGLQR